MVTDVQQRRQMNARQSDTWRVGELQRCDADGCA